MVHRSDLVAAHARIEALERELATLRREGHKPLRCSRCGNPFESRDVDPQRSAILCHRCSARVSLARWPSPDRPRPSATGVMVDDRRGALRVTSRATSGQSLYWAIGFTVLLGATALVALVASMVVAGAASAVLAAVALVVAFRSSPGQLELEATATVLAIRRGSAESPVTTHIPHDQLEQIHVAPGTDAYGAMFRIFAVLKDGTRHLLVDRVDDWPEARRIEGLLETRLGVVDRPVEGEVSRS